MSHPVDRERWFAFRSERLRACMESWLTAHGIRSVERPTWHVPTAQEVHVEPATNSEATPESPETHPSRPAPVDGHRQRLHELVDALASRELEMAQTFLEFLRDRRVSSRPRPKPASEPVPVAATRAAEND